MFIVIDGIDGSGKGTQVRLTVENLEKMGKKVKILDYPRYDKQSSFMVRKYLNGEYGREVSPKLSSIFYAIDRYDSMLELKNDFQTYDYIISNRYVSANVIHQSGKIQDKQQREEFINWIEDLEYNIFRIPKPDKTIFLSVSPEMSQKLVLMKEERGYIKNGKKMDIHEEDKNHLTNAYNAAQEVLEKKEDWIKIDCEKNGEMRSIEDINIDILNEILN